MTARYGVLGRPVLTAELLSLVKTGRVFSLSYPLSSRTPYASTTSRFSARPLRSHEEPLDDGPFREASEVLEMSSHTATHLEALCHIAEVADGGLLLYGDVPVPEVATDEGFRGLGIEECPPILARGLLLDVAAGKGLDVLPDSYGITEDDLLDCCRLQGVEIRPGDCVLLRTGFSAYREAERERFATVGAGPTPEACRWLAEQGICLTGSDTMSFEQVPSPHLGHLELVRRRGILVVKQANLDEIARERIFEFLFLTAPLKLAGATASPVNPLAIC